MAPEVTSDGWSGQVRTVGGKAAPLEATGVHRAPRWWLYGPASLRLEESKDSMKNRMPHGATGEKRQLERAKRLSAPCRGLSYFSVNA